MGLIYLQNTQSKPVSSDTYLILDFSKNLHFCVFLPHFYPRFISYCFHPHVFSGVLPFTGFFL